MSAVPWASYGSAFLMALLGGLHCAAMCGGLLTAISLRDAERPPGSLWGLAAYHAGRLASYAALGALAGALSGLAPWRELRQLQLGLYALAGLVLCFLGWRLWLGRQGFPAVERIVAKGLAPLRALFANLLRERGMTARLMVGALWGLTPCGMVYGAIALALLTGGALAGAGLMFAFGLGTLPNLLLAQWLLGRAAVKAAHWRKLGGLLVLGMGVYALVRVFFAPQSIALAPFCAAP